MRVRFTLNGCPKELECRAGDNVQQLLFNLGMHSVRNSDDGFGFAGSDAILFNHTIHNASLLIAAQLDNATIMTAESLASWDQLSIVQQAMIDVGIVQSGYNDPAAALIITDLLNRTLILIVNRSMTHYLVYSVAMPVTNSFIRSSI